MEDISNPSYNHFDNQEGYVSNFPQFDTEDEFTSGLKIFFQESPKSEFGIKNADAGYDSAFNSTSSSGEPVIIAMDIEETHSNDYQLQEQDPATEIESDDNLTESKTEELKAPSCRKLDKESINKKIKTHAFEGIRKILSDAIKVCFGTKFEIKKFNQELIKNGNINVNKVLLEMSAKEILTVVDIGQLLGKEIILKDSDLKKLQNNQKVIQMVELYMNETLSIFNLKLEELINMYFESKYFNSDLKKLKTKETKQYIEAFLKLKGQFITYFKEEKGNSHYIKKPKQVKFATFSKQ